MPSHPRIYSDGYPRARGPYFARPPSFQQEQAPQSPRSGPPPEYAPPRWYDHQHPREQVWQPPPSGNRGRMAHRFGEGEAVYHFPLRRRQMQHVPETPASQEPWTVPKPKSQERKNNAVLLAEKSTSSVEAPNGKKKKEGDSLSLLAKVSSSMAPPHKRKLMQQQQRNEENESEDPEITGERTNSPSAATPRATRASGDTSPVQPGNGFCGGPAITPYNITKAVPVSVNVVPKPITPTGHPANNYHPFHAQPRPLQHYSGPLYMEERGPRYYGPPTQPQPRGVYSSGPSAIHHFYHPGTHGPLTPQISSYACGESWNSPKVERAYYSQHPAVVERNSFDSAENPISSVPHHEGEGYWQSPFPAVSPYHGRYEGAGPYLPPRWSHEGQVPLAYPRHLGPPHPYMEEHMDGDRFSASRNVAPYTYVQQPSLESKTLLRKKFSWKNYPELERFLIENREEYLEHSSRNYTVAQKQYNNMLTERLLDVAEKAGYAFDQDEFNFVSIRDRIRCYYKSYVQTVRKRGLPLPGYNIGSNKKAKTSNADGGDHGDENEADEDNSESAQSLSVMK